MCQIHFFQGVKLSSKKNKTKKKKTKKDNEDVDDLNWAAADTTTK